MSAEDRQHEQETRQQLKLPSSGAPAPPAGQQPGDPVQDAPRAGRWSRHLPPRLKLVWDWLRWPAQPALALVFLYACLFLLQIVGLAPDLTTGPRPGLSLQLEAESMFSDDDWTLSGRAQPGMVVEIGLNQRVIETTLSQADGSFSVRLDTPPQVNLVWARALDPATGQVLAEESLPIQWAGEVIPALDLAVHVSDAGWLWVAGRAAPQTSVYLLGQAGAELGQVETDSFGIFDRRIPLSGEPPETLLARVGEGGQGLVSDPVPVAPLSLAELPLARRADVELKADKPHIRARIELPASHPHFLALARGYLSPNDFVAATLGWLPESYGIAYTQTLSTQAGLATVDLAGEWPWPIPGFRLSRGRGLASDPLLTDRDRVTLHFDELRPAWFEDPLPTDLQPETATWRGPLAEGASYYLIQVGLDVPSELLASLWRRFRPPDQPAAAEVERQRAEEKMDEFLANVEARVTGDLVSQTWRALILLIPYGALLWLARRRPFGRPDAWKPITALVLVLAAWRVWNYLYFLLLAGPANWMQRLVTPYRYALGLGGTETQSRFLADAGGHAFWLLFIPALALAPRYLPLVEDRLGWRPPQASARRSCLGRAWRGLRWGYAVILLALLALTTQLRPAPFYRYEQLDRSLGRAASFLYQLGVQPPDQDLVFFLLSTLESDLTRSILQLVLLILLVLPFSRRASLWGLGLLVVVLRALATHPYLEWPPDLAAPRDLASQVPWWAAVAFAGLTAYPLVLHLLGRLAPTLPDQKPGWPVRRLALVLIVAALTLSRWPAQWLLGVAGALIAWAISWLVISGLRELEPIQSLKAWVDRWPRAFFAASAAVSLLFIWPIPRPGTALRLTDLFRLVAELDGIFVYVLALALILLMRDYASRRRKDRVVLNPAALEAAVVLFAVFLLNSSSRWLFIPVPFLMGLLMARFWLFRPMTGVRSLRSVLTEAAESRQRLIQDILDAASAKTRLDTIRKALTKKLEGAELGLAEYKTRLGDYEQEFGQELTLEEVRPGYPSRDIVFAVGETELWKNTRIVVKYGAVLATIPLLIALYEYLPVGQVRYPYPLADLVVFLVQSIASWLLYAFFFGYFYVHLRGNSGLAKGLHLFVGLVVPFAVYRLLSTQSLAEMRSFLLWVTQIFLFCTLLGLASVDYRLLRQSGFQLRDLLAVHNLPVLSVYASSVVAALIPSIVAIITGRLSDVVRFFLENVLPQVPGGGP